MLPLKPHLADEELLWVTFPTADALSSLAEDNVVHAFHPTTRNVPNLLRNAALAVRVFARRRPTAIVSTGAGVAVPFFVLGWILRVPTVYIEVFDRIDSPTMTGRLCRPFASRMLVQWEEQLSLYRNAQLVGPLL
jgi:UDP-N-acetylglucosamine:LPS N-acetylglucosamine transferase